MTWDKEDGQEASAAEGSSGPSATGQMMFGRYRPIASLGQGGMANIYLAVALGPAGFNKLMVVKALRTDLEAHSEEFAEMFLDEARLSARLNHPNIVQTFEIGEGEGRPFIAMEYLEGQPMRVVQRRLGRTGLPLEEEIRVIAETARGLHHAHELRGLQREFLGVVHRDVSPQNVFLTYDGQVKLLDFGIAKARGAEHLTKVGVIKGKLDYIAPEQIRGERVDRRADVFSLGAMLWEAATGRRFAGGSQISEITKMHHRLTGSEPRASELNPDLPESLCAIIDRARALDAAERFPTAAVLADELEGFLSSMGMHPTARTLSDRLHAPFAAERAKIGALIDQQVALAVQSSQPEGALPNLGRSDLSLSGIGTASGVLDIGSSSFGMFDGRASRPSGAAFAAPAAPSLNPPAPRSRVLSRPKVLTVVAVLGLASATALLMHKEKPEFGAPSAGEPAEASTSDSAAFVPGATHTAPNKTQTAQAFHLSIHVLPEGAQATLDGSSLPKLPFAADLTRDGLLHHLEASAPGYASKRVLVPFDRDREVIILLDPLPSGLPRPRHAKQPAQTDAATSSDSLSAPPQPEWVPGAKIPTRQRIRTNIDTVDPYAN
jgi:serine/threonine-protein kinase